MCKSFQAAKAASAGSQGLQPNVVKLRRKQLNTNGMVQKSPN